MPNKPRYIIVAGVNGSGKSTFYRAFLSYFITTQRINVDEILRRNGGDWRKISDNMKAMREVIQLMNHAIENQISFHQETTLSGQGHKRWIEKAKEKGFEVTLLYFGLKHVDLAVDRVKHRVAKGGHGIPEETIRKRFQQSLKNLEIIASLCDCVELYDNTDSFTLVYERKNNQLVIPPAKNSEWIPDSFN